MRYILSLITFILLTSISHSQILLLMDNGASYEAETLTYLARVEADGGEIIDIDAVNNAYKFAKTAGGLDSVRCWLGGNYGVKKDANNKVLVWYDLTEHNNDALLYVGQDTSFSPTWYADSLSGKATLKFFGNKMRLEILDDGSNLDFGQNTFYAHFVTQPQTALDYNEIWSKGQTDNIRLFGYFAPGMAILWGNDGQVYNPSTATITLFDNHYLGFGINASTNKSILTLDDSPTVQDITLSGTGSNSLSSFIGCKYGGGYYWNGLISEIIFSTITTDFATFLNSKYAIY